MGITIILTFLFTKSFVKNTALFFPIFLCTGIKYVFEYKFLVPKTPPMVPLFLHLTDFLAFIIFFYFIINYLIFRKLSPDPFLKYFFLFFFFLFISLIFSYDKIFSLFHILMFFNGYIIYRFILDNLEKNRDDNIKIFIFAYLIFLTFNILLGVIQFIFGYIPFMGKEFMEIHGFEIKRIRGVFVHGNSLGGILALSIPPFLSFYFSKDFKNFSIRLKLIYFFFLLVLFFSLFFTYSRNSLISCAVGVLSFLLIYSWKIKKLNLFLRYFLLFSISLLVIIFLSKFTFEKVYERILSIFRIQEDISFQIRLYYWKNSLRTFLKYPFFGIGISQFIYMPYAFFVIIPHNLYIQLLLETGIFGFLSFIFLIGSIIKSLFLCVKKVDLNEKYSWMPIGLIGSWFAFLNHNLLDSSWTTINHNEEMKIFFIMITLSVFIYKKLYLNKTSIK
ncbi:MAG: O-antigen ligase family protein [candidate division WOR-3 bacterium]